MRGSVRRSETRSLVDRGKEELSTFCLDSSLPLFTHLPRAGFLDLSPVSRVLGVLPAETLPLGFLDLSNRGYSLRDGAQTKEAATTGMPVKSAQHNESAKHMKKIVSSVMV